jgi:hypothetical protein
MTDTMNEALASPQAIAAVEDALRAFAKALRAVQLYLPNNSTRASIVALARQAFAGVWEEVDALELHVRENSFTWEERTVYSDLERAGESLPWLLYRDGLRSLTIERGFEETDLEPLLTILQRARAATADDDDLVTMLWVGDLQHVRYRYVESSGVGDMVVVSSADPKTALIPGTGDLPVAETAAAVQAAAEAPAGLIRMEDFDSTLYFLDQREAAYLQEELKREYAEDQRKLVITSLFDIIETRPEVEAQQEALGLLDQLVIEFLTLGDYEIVAFILREASTTAGRPATSGAIRDALQELPARLSEPTVMAQLLHALDESARTPVASLLEGLFSELRPSALEPLVAWLGGAAASPARAAVERASLRLAGAYSADVAKLLEHPRDAVVRGALRLLQQLASPAAVPGLAKLLKSGELKLRIDVVGVLSDIGSPAAMQAVERAMEDGEREVRVAAFRAIGARQHVGALPRLLDAVRRKETRSVDLGEKMALFEAFGSMCGDAGVDELDEILNARGLLGAKEPAELRACAARALGLIGTPDAVAALQRSVETKDVVVRSAVSRALRGGA